MKKLTLDETWKRCLSMWRWIAKQRKSGRQQTVPGLKCEWLQVNDPHAHLGADCYFCEYMETHRSQGKDKCPGCPGCRVDPTFSCLGTPYDYHDPIKFLRKLEQLNRKRRGGK